MLNDRQYLILDLLVQSRTPLNVEDIVRVVCKSKRTIMRDLSNIKMQLEQQNMGTLFHNVDGKGYKVSIRDNEIYEDFINKSLKDEEIILFELIQKDVVTLDDISRKLFVTKISASQKMNVLKETYQDVLDILVTSKGHCLKEPLEKKCLLLSNLVDLNLKKYLSLLNINVSVYEQLESVLTNNQEILDGFPNVNIRQLANIFIASLFFDSKESIKNDPFDDVFQQVGVTSSAFTQSLRLRVSDVCVNMNLSISIQQIKIVLHIIEKQNGLRFEEDELSTQLYHHLKRMLCYPYYLKMKEVHNISKLKALYPLSFDLGISFVKLMQQNYHYQIPNPDFIGLYFAVGLQNINKTRHHIIIYSKVNAIASINKQLLETALSHCDISIVEDKQRMLCADATLVINSFDTEENLRKDNQEVIYAGYILNDKDISAIQERLENINIKQNVATIFPREYSFHYEVKGCECFYEHLKNICDRLQCMGALSKQEVERILNREQQGNHLMVHNYCIPHCISTRDDFCVCIYVSLSQELQVEDQNIQHVLITLMSPKMQNNQNIFKFLYRYLTMYHVELTQIETYEEFIKYI